MAYFGLSNPFIAKLNTATGTYSEGFQCGAAVGTDITPNYAEGSLYGDNTLQEYVRKFRGADVTMTVTTLPAQAETTMFGHTTDETTGETVYNEKDEANYVGYGFIRTEIEKGEESHTAAFLPKCKFEGSAESYTTRGENIEFKTPSLAGKAMADPTGQWRYKNTFESYEAAASYLREKLNISDTTSDPATEPETP